MIPGFLSLSAVWIGLGGFVLGVLLTAGVLACANSRRQRQNPRNRVDEIVGADEDLARLRDRIRHVVDEKVRTRRREVDPPHEEDQ